MLSQSLQPDASLDVLHQHVATKLGLDAAFHLTCVGDLETIPTAAAMITYSNTFRLSRFRDVDGTVVTLRDEEDWECESCPVGDPSTLDADSSTSFVIIGAVDIAREGVTSPVGTGQLEIEVVVP